MSITDIAAGRMAETPARTFGHRRVPPAPVQPRPEPIPYQASRLARRLASAALPAARRLLYGFPARLRELMRHSLQSLAGLPGLLPLGMKSLALAIKPNEARSRQAVIRALLRPDASATFVRMTVYVSALAGLALTAAYFIRSNPIVADADPAPVPEWVQVAKPFPAFSLPMSELAESGQDYLMRRHVAGGGRQDILTWGELEGAAPHLMVEIYRPVAERARFDSAEREIARRLEAAAAAAIKPAGEMQTKFGAVSLVEFSVTPARQCLGFVRSYRDPQLQILGWHCTSGSAPVERDLTACALDRLTLLAAGSEPKIRELFARAELKRNFCGQRSYLYTPTPKRAWSGEVGTGSPTKTMRH